ncbi:hypothetical protein E7T09_10110 [Deinococcus sp. KSM4-11]|uniref:SRPBCC family protein n=1 Tax=Deinococcus sp. KSM4-11 TaxID=2568654 RepID=UPI0010A4C784|nr:SRPBCC family protein [Deinococcus sp. KSM4-11]THF86472.1 hypothetical protein E7T09_10110 [Deinococcus sp. KSM4-11]
MHPLARGAVGGAVAGAAYGLTVYVWLHRLNGDVGVMVASYLFLVPFALGMLSAWLALEGTPVRPAATPPDAFGDRSPRAVSPVARVLGVSALTVSVFLVVALVTGFEGVLCAVIAAPVMYPMALLGAGLMWVLRRWRGRSVALLVSATLPAVLGPLEQTRPVADVYRTVTNDVLIAAPPAAVWAQIRSVPRIGDSEIRAGFFHWVGLPRPREAVLVGQGVGAARTATFDGGLSFLETVTDWRVNRVLSFRIQAQQSGTLDPHIRVGGRFFDVLSGTYTLEAVRPGFTLLHLSSTQRVSTPFNGYTAFFTRVIMHDLQRTILEVIRDRAERASARPDGPGRVD